MNRLDCDSRRNTIMLSVKCVPFSGLHLPACYCELQHSDIGILAALVKVNAQTEFIKLARKTSLDNNAPNKIPPAPCELHTLRPLPFLCCTEQYNVQSSHTCPSSPLFGALAVYNRVQMCTAQQVDRQWGYTVYAALTLWMQSQTRQCVRGPGRTGWDISVACETPARQQHTHDLILLHCICSWINRTRMVQCLCVHVPP